MTKPFLSWLKSRDIRYYAKPSWRQRLRGKTARLMTKCCLAFSAKVTLKSASFPPPLSVIYLFLIIKKTSRKNQPLPTPAWLSSSLLNLTNGNIYYASHTPSRNVIRSSLNSDIPNSLTLISPRGRTPTLNHTKPKLPILYNIITS
jgi:uncharacterized membrane protein